MLKYFYYKIANYILDIRLFFARGRNNALREEYEKLRKKLED